MLPLATAEQCTRRPVCFRRAGTAAGHPHRFKRKRSCRRFCCLASQPPRDMCSMPRAPARRAGTAAGHPHRFKRKRSCRRFCCLASQPPQDMCSMPRARARKICDSFEKKYCQPPGRAAFRCFARGHRKYATVIHKTTETASGPAPRRRPPEKKKGGGRHAVSFSVY